jgi:TolA-binding protein
VKDPERLLDDGANELELTLLQAGDADMPSAQSRQAALAALGLSGALLSAAPPAAAAGSAAISSGARLLAAKWWAIGALVTASGAAGLGYATLRGAPAPTPSVSHVAERAPAPAVAGPAVEPAPESSDRPTAVPSSRERLQPLPSPRSSSSAGSSGIQEQIALIDRARSAVAAHQPGAALAALDEYQRRYPGGVLVQEAALLRIESLLARGDKASAARLGHQFLQRYPRSPMAARVKTLTDG